MQIQHNISLQALHTLHLDVSARFFYRWQENDKLDELLAHAKNYKRTIWLGSGSNTIFLQDVDDGLVVQIATNGIEVIEEDEQVRISVSAGNNWHQFVQYTLANGWYGLENLSLIPGTVGASPVQNIGAYGVEVKDHITRVFGVNTDNGEAFVMNNNECQFSYRNSIFKQSPHLLITEVEFVLSKQFIPHIDYGDIARVAQAIAGNEKLNANHVANAIIQTRKAKLPNPDKMGNVGSFFHNPIVPADYAKELLQKYPNMPHYPQADEKVKIAAAWLIEQAGLKGKKCGNMAVHQQQALVLVNTGGAIAQDVIDLKSLIQSTVLERFGIELICEPRFIT
ncbi:MAG: UDP-N-acetylmuramate dehydrogenase [Neisseriaceae bacterium]|nr:UDP-N-acetylmuramate dehydrogenase [Neisseriaceae bacterium]